VQANASLDGRAGGTGVELGSCLPGSAGSAMTPPPYPIGERIKKIRQPSEEVLEIQLADGGRIRLKAGIRHDPTYGLMPTLELKCVQ
jgi:hypothetical protein